MYHQLLATETIIESFDFSSVNPYPIGISIIASFLIMLNIDPILFFHIMSPIILVVIFILLVNALKPTGIYESMFLSYNFCVNLYFLKSFNQFNAEIVSFLFMSILIFYILTNRKRIEELHLKHVMVVIVLSWINIMIRDAMVFFVIGCFLYLIFQQYLVKKNMLFTFLLIPIALLPIITRIFDNNQSEGLMTLLSNENFNARLIVILSSFSDFHKYLPEMILPKLERFSSYNFFTLFISILVIIIAVYHFAIYITNYKSVKNKEMNILLFFSIVGFTYLTGISIASGLFNYEWISLYRVSGLSISFLSIPFWIVVLRKDRRKNLNFKLLIIIFFFLTQAKYLYAVKYENYYSTKRLLFEDHREINNNIIDETNLISKTNQINVYVGGAWPGRNLYRILQYNNYFYEQDSIIINPIWDFDANKNTIISKLDYINFEYQRDSLKIKTMLDGDFLFCSPNK